MVVAWHLNGETMTMPSSRMPSVAPMWAMDRMYNVVTFAFDEDACSLQQLVFVLEETQSHSRMSYVSSSNMMRIYWYHEDESVWEKSDIGDETQLSRISKGEQRMRNFGDPLSRCN